MARALKTYHSKRNFKLTPEPEGAVEQGGPALSFVIQKHWATRLHYDFRLELDGVMLSWAVPKGPSYDPHDKRMAVHVEDHPISYQCFEGEIPAGQYGAGKVIIWDNGSWRPLEEPHEALRRGSLKFELDGHKMHGRWALVRMKGKGESKEPWLLIKEKDAYARPAAEFSVVDEMPDSVAQRQLPDVLSPQLATLVDQAPETAEDWIFEVKYDGYRLLARVAGQDIRLVTRNGNDWTHRLKPLRNALAALQLPDGWYDGEIVVLDDDGRPSFGLLQNAFDDERTGDIIYYLFDMPFQEGRDLRALPLEQRRARLKGVLEAAPGEMVRFSESLSAAPQEVLAAACQMGLEGIIGKRRDSVYVSRRSRDWIKLKCGLRQEFVIGGYTDPQGSRPGFGSLLLGTYDRDGQLQYAGNVGSGFDARTLDTLATRLRALAIDERPFAPGRTIDRRAHWVKPQLVAEVHFGEWTRDGSIRHAVYKGLRTDKSAAKVRREKAERAPAAHRDDKPRTSVVRNTGALPASLKITHPERLIDAASGTTKIALLRYYALVGQLMLRHLKGRPVSLVRAPAGVGGELFFQKHAGTGKLPGVHQLDPALDPDHPPMLEIASMEGLLSAAQWNMVELHTQNAIATSYETPNRMVFDLDPGQDVTWRQMQEAAELTRGMLEELNLRCFLKTSGGKGLHVVAPLRSRYDWETVKAVAQAIVAHMAATLPERFALKSGPRNRVGRIFIDYLRNGRGATTVCAWSARARPGLGISVPLGWDELARLRSGDQWNVSNVHQRLDVGNAPWQDYARAGRSLTPAIKKLGVALP